jgi:hypothetical protein
MVNLIVSCLLPRDRGVRLGGGQRPILGNLLYLRVPVGSSHPNSKFINVLRRVFSFFLCVNSE